jgi:sialate O-acetylesterase
MKKISGIFFGFLVLIPVSGAIRLPRLVSNGMVVQRDIPLKIWGWAGNGKTVTVAFRGVITSAVAGNDGKWLVTLPAQKAGGPFEMKITEDDTVILHDILVGEVWVCSGQSNMELPMARVKYKYPDDIASSENPMIRQFIVPLHYDFTSPKDDLNGGTWESANPRSIMNFSAVGYFFARTLFEKYHVPVGLIRSAAGGTPAEAWMSEDALRDFPVFIEDARKCADTAYVNSIRRSEKAASDNWYRKLAQNDKAYHSGPVSWRDTLFDASGWQLFKIPGMLAEQVNDKIIGCVWFRKTVTVPAEMAGKTGKLWLGRIVDADSVFLNGKFTGTTSYQYPPRIYDIPAGLLKKGDNLIVVKVICNAGQGGFIPDKPYQLTAGDKVIDLSGEWQYQVSTTQEPAPSSTFFQYKPVGLFNGMISPLLNFSIRGVVWYQGESNASDPNQYARLMPSLINDWRTKWKLGDFPFLVVQLPNYMNAVDTPSESNWAEMRQVQMQLLSMPETGLAVTYDLGEWNDIHPLNKKDVGIRLAAEASRLAYVEKNTVSSPLYKSMKIKGNRVEITFSNTGSGLVAKDGKELKYFSVAGADRKFYWAKAMIKNNKVIVWCDQVARPVAVRYAWADNPRGANLYNKEGFPASPFEAQ